MTDELIAYLLDDLCPERRAGVEERLRSDAAWQREYERLKECLAETESSAACGEGKDGDKTAEPPQDLVRRTCCYVTESERVAHAQQHRARLTGCRQGVSGEPALVGAGAPMGLVGTWSLADMTVGGGVLLLLGMLVLPALRETRDASRRVACQNNLKSLGASLLAYQDNHGGWLPPVAPGENAAQFAVGLAENAGVTRQQLGEWLRCPDAVGTDDGETDVAPVAVPAAEEFYRASGDERLAMIQAMTGSYAYQVGYLDGRKVYHFVKFTGGSDQPMLADAPLLTQSGVRSASHAGAGQNVLDQSLSVRFRTNCDLAVSLDNIFLNKNGQHAAGCDRGDKVLIRGDHCLRGPAELVDWSQPPVMAPAAN